LWNNSSVLKPRRVNRATRAWGWLVVAAAAMSACTGHSSQTTVEPTTAPSASPSTTSPPRTLVTVADVRDGLDVQSGRVGTFNWAGQSVTIPAGRTFEGVIFNWYTSSGEPAAFGRLYLLNQEFMGAPRDVGPTMPGFLSRSESIVNGAYVFPADVSLASGVRYWFYTDTQGSFVGSFDTDIYPGGDLYVSGVPTFPFHKAGASGHYQGPVFVPGPPGVFVDANFRLQGYTKPQ
jgi:hypothetical protein